MKCHLAKDCDVGLISFDARGAKPGAQWPLSGDWRVTEPKKTRVPGPQHKQTHPPHTIHACKYLLSFSVLGPGQVENKRDGEGKTDSKQMTTQIWTGRLGPDPTASEGFGPLPSRQQEAPE